MNEDRNLTGQEGGTEGAAAQEVITEELTQEKLAEQFNAAAEGGGGGKGEGEGEGGEGAGAGDGNSGGGEEFKMPLDEEEIGAFQEVLGIEFKDEDFKKEDGTAMSKKEAITLLNKAVANKSKEELIKDPFINNYLQESKKEGFSKDSYIKKLIKENTINEKSSRAFLTEYFRDKGHSDEKIEKYFNNKTDIEIEEMASEKKKIVIQEERLKQEQENKQYVERVNLEYDKFNKVVSSMVSKYVDDSIVAGDFPIKLAESDVEKVKTKMLELTEKKLINKNGTYYEEMGLDKFMKDDKKLLKVLPYIALEELGELDDRIKSTIREAKNREFEKIDGTNPLGTGGKPSGGTNWSKFMGNS
jgi:hypothetical protein